MPASVETPCIHFGFCGGCAAQHLAGEDYAAWKRALLLRPWPDSGLDADVVAPLVAVPPGTRRRATLAVRRTGEALAVGFMAARSHDLVDLAMCKVLLPPLEALVPALRAALAPILPKAGGDVALTWTASGIDADLRPEGAAPLTPQRTQAIAGLAAALDLARVAWNGEPVAVRRVPVILIDGVSVATPPGAFLQASAEGETALTALVRDAAAGARRIADLFAGLGTFTLPLARIAPVHAVEAAADALAALDAARKAPGLKPVTVERRDLFRRPLLADELAPFDTVVFDPPRQGAARQAAALAESPVRRIIAVSCAPATLARDCAQLVQGGYRILRVTPVDQFVWSSHLEAVAVLERPGRAKGRRN